MLFANITDCEMYVYKVILDSAEPTTLVSIQEELLAKYEKDWKRSTICTFILHLVEKGYVTSYRKGRSFYYSSVIDKNEFAKAQSEAFLGFWFDGKLSVMDELLQGEKVFGAE